MEGFRVTGHVACTLSASVLFQSAQLCTGNGLNLPCSFFIYFYWWFLFLLIRLYEKLAENEQAASAYTEYILETERRGVSDTSYMQYTISEQGS